MYQRPENANPWPGRPDLIPPELLHTREWLHEMFKQAGRGLPWPHQMSLMLIEQAIMVGMFGGLLASAWLLTQQGQGQFNDPANFDLGQFLAQLESSATDTLPEPLQLAIGHVRSHLEGNPFERTVAGLWEQMWGPDGPPPPFPPGGMR
jgi:hypothetical protein